MTGTRHRRAAAPRRLFTLIGALLVAVIVGGTLAGPASAASYVPISGAGSTWSSNALEQWIRNVNQYGIKVSYQATGSSDGRNQFRNGTVDFGVSEIPYGLTDGRVQDDPPKRGYAYMPIVAGGTSFMYNLKIGGKRVTNLRLSGSTLAKIFTGVIKTWNDPAVKADNPGLTLPARRVVPVVRSDGSGTTAQLTTYFVKRQSAIWGAYCSKLGINPCTLTSNFPASSGMVAQSGSLGVAGYTAQDQSDGAITYVEYSYAQNSGFPIAKVLNSAGYYVEPTAPSVAVALLGAKINTDKNSSQYLTQILDGVYDNADRRTYPLSSYSYMVVPTKVENNFSNAKGATLGAFAYYFLCEGQKQAPVLGYSPLPINLVRAGLEQVRRIPGVQAQSIDIAKCNNPTFSKDGTNTVAKTAPQPQACDKQGSSQCNTGTGGAKNTPTAVKPAAQGNTQGTGTKATGSQTGTGGSSSNAGGSADSGGSADTGGSAGSDTSGGGSDTGGNTSDPDTATANGGSSTGTGGADSSGGTGSTETTVDPDTGKTVTTSSTDNSGATDVAAVPVSTSSSIGSSGQALLMVFAALLLLAAVLGPPLIARRLEARRRP